jgi:hypothetical protein
MSAQRRYLLLTVPLLAAVVVWAGYSVTKRTHVPSTHAEIAGPAAVKANADQLPGTVVTPHLECAITPGNNVLWCATFQIAWNELCDLLGGPIQCNDAPEMVSILNKRAVTYRDVDEASYVAVAGYITQDPNDIRQKIAHELDRKFKGAASPELLHVLDSASAGTWASYAYLFKELPFERAFKRMRRSFVFDGREVESFGIRQLLQEDKKEAKAANQVLVYDYKSNDDFIVELQTQSKSDRLILAKIPPGRTLAETVATAWTRVQQSKPGSMQNHADFFTPVIDFDVLRHYHELARIGIALQQIRFKLSERGAILKSESVMVKAAALKNLVFDKPFLIMIQRTDASQPYFALWVANAELLVPFQPRN